MTSTSRLAFALIALLLLPSCGGGDPGQATGAEGSETVADVTVPDDAPGDDLPPSDATEGSEDAPVADEGPVEDVPTPEDVPEPDDVPIPKDVPAPADADDADDAAEPEDTDESTKTICYVGATTLECTFASEVCVKKIDLGAAWHCVDAPAGCDDDRSCDCLDGNAFCEGWLSAKNYCCVDLPEENTVGCNYCP